jgi:hypothetical protein
VRSSIIQVKIDNVIREQYLLPFNITDDEVYDTILHEDIRKVIPLNHDNKLIMFLKDKQDFCLLVDGRQSGDYLLVYAVFKILSKTAKKANINNPLAVLQELAAECGYEIQIGEQRGTFILNATVPITKIHSEDQYNRVMSQLISIRGWDKNSDDIALQDVLAKWRQGQDHDNIDVALAYAISTNKYMQYLGISKDK